MFWGCTIKKGNDHKFEAEDQAILHVSNAALGLNAKGTAAVFAKVDGKEFVITHLTAGKTEHTSLDLYFRNDQEVTFGVKGEAEVHLSGYFEPDHGDDEEDMYGDFPYGEEEDDEEEDDEELEDESEEEVKPVAKKPVAIAEAAKKAPEAAKKTPEVVKKTEAAPKPAETKKQPSLQETLALKKAAELAAAKKAAASAFEDDEDDEDDDDLDIEDEDDDDEDLEDDEDDEDLEDDGDIDDDVTDSDNEALDQMLKKSKGNNAQAVAKPQAQAQKPQQ